MLCDVMRQQNGQTGLDPDFIEDCISNGHEWAIAWQYPGLLGGNDETPPKVNEVCDILTMYSVLKSSFDQLNDDDKETVIAQASVNKAGIRFPGFDGNNETDHMSITKVMIDELGRFTDLEAPSYDLHRQMLPTYRNQLTEYDKEIGATSFGQSLSKESIIKILNA